MIVISSHRGNRITGKCHNYCVFLSLKKKRNGIMMSSLDVKQQTINQSI